MVVVVGMPANKRMVLTLPALRSFGIIARPKRLGAGIGFVLPVKARAGRTCEALAIYIIPQIHSKTYRKSFYDSVIRHVAWENLIPAHLLLNHGFYTVKN